MTAEFGDVPGKSEDADPRLTLIDALARISTRDRAIVVLRYWEDLSVESVAEILGLQIISGGRATDVTFTEADDADLPAVDTAYRRKYSQYAGIVDHLVQEGPRSATLRRQPAGRL